MGDQVNRPADISQEDWDSVDVPEATDTEFAAAKSFKDLFLINIGHGRRWGVGEIEAPKVHIGFRLAVDVVDAIRATGRGYNARVEKVLRDALAEGKL